MTIPAHKFLHVKTMRKQRVLGLLAEAEPHPGQDCETVCGLLDSIKGSWTTTAEARSNRAAVSLWRTW